MIRGLSLPFPPFLSEDNDTSWDLTNNSGGGSDYGRAVTKLLNTNLRTLLEAEDAIFYKTFESNASLIKFLDTFLRFRDRNIDGLWSTSKFATAAEAAARSTMMDDRKAASLKNLDRRVLTTYYRLMTNGDVTGTLLHDVLTKRHVIDVPKLLDLCSLYGRQHPKHVRTVVETALRTSPEHAAELRQSWAYMNKALTKSAQVLKQSAPGGGGGSSSGGGGGGGEKKRGDTSKERGRARDVLKYIVDVLDTSFSFIETCPNVFRATCEDPAALLLSVSLWLEAATTDALLVFTSLDDGGMHDVESNAIHVIQSLSLRFSYSMLHHCFLTPLETAYRRETTSEEEQQQSSQQSSQQQQSSQSSQSSVALPPEKKSMSVIFWSILNSMLENETMIGMRKGLQIHYNLAGRVQRLIDARALDGDTFSGLVAVMFEDAPIPISIMEEELNDETEIDVILRESKNKEDAIRQKTSFNAKKRMKKGILHDEDWMRDEEERYGGGGVGVGGKRRAVDQKLRAAMLAIMSKYDEDDDMDDTLDVMTSTLRLRSDASTYSDDEDEDKYGVGEGEGEGEEEEEEGEGVEILEVNEINGVATGVVRNAAGKRVEVLMPNMNRHVQPGAASRGRGRRKGGGSHIDTRKCFKCGQSGHLSNECPNPRLTGSEMGKIKKAKKEKKIANQSKGVSGGGSGNAKGTGAGNERTRKRNEKNKSSKANHNRKRGALKKASKGM